MPEETPTERLERLLEELHCELASQLLAKIRCGEATAKDYDVARQFLKDNAMQGVPNKNSPALKLAQEVPFGSEDEAATG